MIGFPVDSNKVALYIPPSDSSSDSEEESLQGTDKNPSESNLPVVRKHLYTDKELEEILELSEKVKKLQNRFAALQKMEEKSDEEEEKAKPIPKPKVHLIDVDNKNVQIISQKEYEEMMLGYVWRSQTQQIFDSVRKEKKPFKKKSKSE